MSKKPSLDDLIITVLENGPLSGKKLKEKIDDELPLGKTLKGRNTTLNESIIRLIDKNIIDYDGHLPKSENERRQAFKSDFIIFSLVKKDHLEIRNLINDLPDNDIKKSKMARKKLNKLFIYRMREIEDKNEIKFRDLNNEETLWIEALKKYYKDIMVQNLNELYLIAENEKYSKAIKYYTEKLKGNINQLSDQNSFLKIRYLANENVTIPLENIVEVETFLKFHLVSEPQNEKEKEELKAEKGFYESSKATDKIWIYEDSTDEEFLKWKLGYSKPIKWDNGELDDLFDDLILYINSQDSGQNALKEKLAMGLSEHKKADNYLNDLISEVEME